METKEKRIEHKIDSKKSIMEYFIYSNNNWAHKLVLFERKNEPLLLYEYVEKDDSIRIYKDKSLGNYKIFFNEHDIVVRDFV